MNRWFEIYAYWFGAPDSEEHGSVREFWFRGGPHVDRDIGERFTDDHGRAAAGAFEDWKDRPQSSLSLVVLLDQVPRNIYRGMPRAFATDDRALSVAKYIVEQPWHDALLPVQRLFAYLPFEHSENIDDQERCVALFEAMDDHPKRDYWLDYAVRHLEIIERFGRFPHRNVILGRQNTPEEAVWLAENDERFGTVTDDTAET